MAETKNFDIVVVGGGPAGYVAAIRAAQLGMSVACVERGNLGGVCLNWGCIPTKALLAGAELFHRMKHDAASWGIEADNVRPNWEKVIARSRAVATPRGVQALFKKHKIPHIQGHARITAPGRVEVMKVPGNAGESSWDVKLNAEAAKANQLDQVLTAKHIVIATGAIARQLPGAEFDGDKIIGAKDAMNLPKQPASLIIVGAGAIGMEFAYFYNAFGTKVTVVEMLDRVLPVEDFEVSAAVEKSFKKQGIEIHTGHKTTGIKKSNGGVEVTIASAKPDSPPGETKTLTAEKVLVAIGVKGRFDGLFTDEMAKKIEIYKDHIKVDRKKYQTSVPGIYAVGDVNGPPWLAHVASEEAVVCVERIAGHHAVDIDYDSIPGCTYCVPQVASVGLTEQACKERNIAYKASKFPFLANGKAQVLGETEGFVKLIAGAEHEEILGAHMVGENVTELIAEMVLARRLEATAEEVIASIHAHPTLSEASHEAALGIKGRTIHF